MERTFRNGNFPEKSIILQDGLMDKCKKLYLMKPFSYNRGGIFLYSDYFAEFY